MVVEVLLDPFRLLEALLLITLLAGLLGLISRRNLFLKALAMDVMSTAVVGLFVLVAARSGLRTPILLDELDDTMTSHQWMLDGTPVVQEVITARTGIGTAAGASASSRAGALSPESSQTSSTSRSRSSAEAGSAMISANA